MASPCRDPAPLPSPPDRSSLRPAASQERVYQVKTQTVVKKGTGSACAALTAHHVNTFFPEAGTCPGAAPSGDPGAVRTQTPLTASEIRWRRGGRDAPASLQSGWRSSSPQTPEVKETDITPLIVEQTPVNSHLKRMNKHPNQSGVPSPSSKSHTHLMNKPAVTLEALSVLTLSFLLVNLSI